MRRMILGVLPVVILMLWVAPQAADAFAEAPWLHLTSSVRPTNLSPGVGKDDVQELVVNEPSTGFCIAAHNEVTESEVACFEGGAEAAVVEVGLQNVVYPERALSVTREKLASSSRYTVTFPNQLVRTMISGPTAAELEFGGEPLVHVTRGESGGELAVTVANLGDGPALGEGAPLTVLDSLPEHVRAVAVEALAGGQGGRNLGAVKCTVAPVRCSFEGTLPPYNQIEFRIGVEVDESATSGQNLVVASGAGAQSAEISSPVKVSSDPTPFGAQNYELALEEEGGVSDTRAGSHPFQLTTTFTMAQGGTKLTPTEKFEVEPIELPKNLNFKLPTGLVGNPTSFPECTLAEFAANKCAENTVLGVAIATYNEPRALGVNMKTVPVYNIEPSKGEPARFGFLPTPETPILLDTSVRTGGDYGVTVSVTNVLQTIGLVSSTVTLWGVPGDKRHDNQRGEGCLAIARGRGGVCTPLEQARPAPFLSLPTSCSGTPLVTSVEINSWARPEDVLDVSATRPLPTLSGCDRLHFGAEVAFAPNQTSASSPSGFALDVHVPQGASLDPDGLLPADVRDMTFALPEGVTLNPSAADGLQACSLAQIGLDNANQPSCPDSSRIGNLVIHTPLLANPLKGYIYLASPQNFSGPPQENPFESLVATYVVASDPASGVLVKLASKITLSPTGQATATLVDSPQLPFEDADVEFYDGQRAPLATPARCGSYTTVGVLTPWSAGEAVTSTSHFAISSGPNGTACPGATLPLSATLSAGTTSVDAGSFSALTTTIGREDGGQDLRSVQLTYPSGISGVLTGVPLCAEAAANAGTCDAASKIGDAVASVGLGSDPFTITGGKVYLTEKYAGAPFGLSIVTPATAGPFTLQQGRPVVVRAKIEIDRLTGALTVTTDAIPHIIEGVPLEIKRVNVNIDRANFTFNPTSCGAKTITGEEEGWEGAISPVSEPFAASNCAKLKFAPKLSASTSAKVSRADGTSLAVKLSYPTAAFGTQANIAEVKVVLPKQLPSRDSTLKKACLAAVFNANPANCPSESIVGEAKVTTPVLPVPLIGNAYFVSHGGQAFPSLTMILHGYGITIELVGDTLIRKGITSTTFHSVPDVPFKQFELRLPRGKFSALGGFGNLCKTKLKMPTSFVAQNGAEIHQTNTIAVSSCPKAKKAKKKKGKK